MLMQAHCVLMWASGLLALDSGSVGAQTYVTSLGMRWLVGKYKGFGM